MFSNPESNINQFRLSLGMKVADFGSGSGGYAYEIAKAVGPKGVVYAIDVQQDLIKRLDALKKEWGFQNIQTIWGDVNNVGGTKIADHTMDAVVISNVLFQSEDKVGVVDEARRILKKNGRVLVIDWADSFGGLGPMPKYLLTKAKAVSLFESRGFKNLETISAGAHHYGIIFSHE